MPLVKFNIEDIKVAVREYLNGKKSLNEVGESHSMTGGNLRHWVIKLGYKPRKNHESRFDEIRIKECCDLYIQGGRTKELAKKYNVDRRTIMDWLIRSEIKPKKFNENENISFFGRCKDRIKYKIEDDIIKGYIPDFYIEYKDGRKIVEEVKPFVFIKKFNNLIKFKSAKEFYKNKNIIFRVTTESAIYVGGFKGNKKLILTN